MLIGHYVSNLWSLMTWVCAFNLERENKVDILFICQFFSKIKNFKLKYFHLKFNEVLSLVKFEVRCHAQAHNMESFLPELRFLRHREDARWRSLGGT